MSVLSKVSTPMLLGELMARCVTDDFKENAYSYEYFCGFLDMMIKEEINKHNPEKLKDTDWLKKNVAFTGELLLGHLRYGTYGGQGVEHCHPFLRQNNWMTRNLVVAGNFNLTNVDELFRQLIELGQHPKEKADTITVMEKIGHFFLPLPCLTRFISLNHCQNQQCTRFRCSRREMKFPGRYRFFRTNKRLHTS